MTDNNKSPFATNLLNTAPTQKKMESAEKELNKVHKNQQSTAAKAKNNTLLKPKWLTRVNPSGGCC
jgi:cellobiose-specific phosphotransferase system component IIA